VITPLLAFSGLFAAIDMERPSWRDVPPVRPSKPASRPAGTASGAPPVPVSQPIVGFIDVLNGKPVLFAREGTRVEVSGWTACSVAGSKLSHVVILIDGAPRAEVKEFFSRPDVAAAFGRSDFEMSGWRTVVPLRDLKAGEHTLVARGVGAAGEIGELPPFRLNIFQ
jgi:hypothetical protein